MFLNMIFNFTKISLPKMALTDDQILALYEPAPPRPSVVSSAEYADNKRICLKRQWDPLSPQCAILMYQPSSPELWTMGLVYQ